jgi:hypothetical protein
VIDACLYNSSCETKEKFNGLVLATRVLVLGFEPYNEIHRCGESFGVYTSDKFIGWTQICLGLT